MNIKNIKIILNQYGGPISLNYQSKAISHITEEMVNFHISSIDKLDTYSISELFSLYYLIEYALKELWNDEFTTVTGLDLYCEGYFLLNSIHEANIDILKSNWFKLEILDTDWEIKFVLPN